MHAITYVYLKLREDPLRSLYDNAIKNSVITISSHCHITHDIIRNLIKIPVRIF